MSPPTLVSSLVAIAAVAVVFIGGGQCEINWRDRFSLTCGLNNPTDRDFGHEGINVKVTDRIINGVRECTFKLIHESHWSSQYIEVEAHNTTASGLPCNASPEVLIGNGPPPADDDTELTGLCGVLNHTEIYPSTVFITIMGDPGGDPEGLDVGVRLVEVDYLKQCNRTWYQNERRIDIDRTLDRLEPLIMPYYCQFSFYVPTNDKVILQVHSVDLKLGSSGCNNNSLIVIDGWEVDHRLLLETCDTKDLTFTSSQNGIMVIVKIVDPTRQSPLSFNFSATPFSITQCYGQVITLKATSEDKYITSPDYPYSFYPHLNCLWEIESEDGNEVEIEFVDMDLTSFDCENDYIVVFDGPNQTSLRLARLCGQLRGEIKKYRSSGKAFMIQFHVDDNNNQGKGFKIRYHTKADPSPDLVPDSTCRQNIVYLPATADDKFLQPFSTAHPAYPSAECRWAIQSRDNNPIEVEIVELDMEASNYCSRDSLDIYDGIDRDVSPLTSVCGPLAGLKSGTKFRSSAKSMLIHFKTDNSIQKGGFKLKYYTKAQPSAGLVDVASCRGKIEYLKSTPEIQNLTSPGYPNGYPLFADCRWQILAEPGNTTKIDVASLNFDTGEGASHANCMDHDYMEVFDGTTIYSNSLGRICEGTRSFESSGRSLTVQFRSNSDDSGEGFELQYYSPFTDTATIKPTGGPGGSTQNKASILITCLSAILILASIHYS